VSSPLVCAAGVSGADLRKRMEEIMKNTITAHLSFPKKALLIASGMVLLMVPLAAGLLTSPASLTAAMAQDGAVCKAVPVPSTHTRPPMLDTMLPGERFITEMMVTVGSDGSVRGVLPMRASGSVPADELAMAHVRQNWRWEPTGCGDARAPVRITQERLPLPQPTSTGRAPIEARPALERAAAPAQSPVQRQGQQQLAQISGPQAAQRPACRAEPVANTHTKPPQPEESIQAGESGTVEVWATVVADGHASDVVVMKSSGFARLDELAARHVRENWMWKPLTCGGVRAPIRIVFTAL
jgi:TonB family protein